MPESLVINLVSESTIPSQYLQGHYLYRLFLALVSAVDNRLSQTLLTRPAFTLSPLQITPTAPNLKSLRPQRQLEITPFANLALPAGTHCWWRISLLDDSLSHLSPRLTKVAASQPWYLGPGRLHVTNVRPTHIPEWISCASYSQLYQQASDRNRELTLKLLTPAVFRQGNQDSPLPSRDAIFHSLRKCWNRYSGLAFTPDTIAPITPQTFALKTVPTDNSETSFGCVGTISFQIAPTADPLTIKRINALASFSRYCGIGYKTNLGLGLVRPLEAIK